MVSENSRLVARDIERHADATKQHHAGQPELGLPGAHRPQAPYESGLLGACTSISCHNGGTATWGATLSCADCHLRTTAQGGDLDDPNIANAVASAVNADEWVNAGHGRPAASGNYPTWAGNPSPNPCRGGFFCCGE